MRKGTFYGRANPSSAKITYEVTAKGHQNATKPTKGKRLRRRSRRRY